MFAAQVAEAGGVGVDGRVRQSRRHVVEALADLGEALFHGRCKRAGVAAPALSLLRGLGAAVALPEPLDASGRVHQLLLARVVRVAGRADLDVDVLAGRTGLPGVAAGAVHRDHLIIGMNIRLHGAPCLRSVVRSLVESPKIAECGAWINLWPWVPRTGCRVPARRPGEAVSWTAEAPP